jgi:small subunit ribosomal protein S19
MSRSKWKGAYISSKLLESFNKTKKNHQTLVVPRNCEIVPKFVGSTFKIHNGKSYSEITVVDEMIGHKFGEFAPTRVRFFFKKKKLKK